MEHWLEPLLDVMNSNENIGAVAPILYKKNRVQNAGILITQNGKIVEKKMFTLEEAQAKADDRGVAECDAVPGGCVLIRREVHQEVKHDTNYFMGYEDIDFWMQMAKAKWEVALCLNSKVIHAPLDDGILRVIKYRRKRFNQEIIQKSREYFKNKWGVEQVVQNDLLQNNLGIYDKMRKGMFSIIKKLIRIG